MAKSAFLKSMELIFQKYTKAKYLYISIPFNILTFENYIKKPA